MICKQTTQRPFEDRHWRCLQHLCLSSERYRYLTWTVRALCRAVDLILSRTHCMSCHREPEKLYSLTSCSRSFYFLSISHRAQYPLRSNTAATVARCLTMPETCVKFGIHGARVMIENREVEHYAIRVDPVEKEVICWIPSEEGKVREYIFFDVHCFTPTNLRSFQLNG